MLSEVFTNTLTPAMRVALDEFTTHHACYITLAINSSLKFDAIVDIFNTLGKDNKSTNSDNSNILLSTTPEYILSAQNNTTHPLHF